MKNIKWLVGVACLGLTGLSGCFHANISDQYISDSMEEFMIYQKETKDRPSPAARAQAQVDQAKVFITYSQPAVKERTIWGELVEYDEVWRTGANEATVFSTNQDLLIEADTLKAGNYAFYTIPKENSWVIILNKQYKTWGAYDYSVDQDVVRFQVTPYQLSDHTERLSFDVNNQGQVSFKWDKLGFDFDVVPIKETMLTCCPKQ